MKTTALLMLGAVLSVAWPGCSKRDASYAEGAAPPQVQHARESFGQGGEAAGETAKSEVFDKGGSTPAAPANPLLPSANAATAPRQMIYKADVELEVKHLRESKEKIETMTRATGGFVGASSLSVAYRAGQAQISARIPAPKLETFLQEIKELGRLLNETRTADDVTREVADMEARIRNLRTTEARLLELKARAGKIADLLEVDREIARVLGERESLEAQLSAAKDLVAYSTVNIVLRPQPETATNADQPGGPAWLPVSEEWRSVIQSVMGSLRNLLSSLLWIAGYSVFWGPPVFLIFLLVWRAKRRAARA